MGQEHSAGCKYDYYKHVSRIAVDGALSVHSAHVSARVGNAQCLRVVRSRVCVS